MIEHLEITNYALIDNLSVDFSEGFNVITGETGSGKSIILGALGLLMGEKADTSSIRTGEDCMTISAIVSIPDNHEILSKLSELGIEPQDGEIVIRRTVKQNGRGSINVQGQLLSRQELTDIADSLIDMHGQSEHQSLLIPEKQRKILDSYSQSHDLVRACFDCYHMINSINKRIEEAKKQLEEGIRQEDYLRFALSEIEHANLKRGEDEELKERISVLSQSEVIAENLNDCNEKLKMAKNLLIDARQTCKKAAKCDSSLECYSERLAGASIETEDLSDSISQYLASVDFSEDTVNSMQERLALIQRLKKKYGPTLDDVASFAEKAKESLEIADNREQILGELSSELERTMSEYRKTSEKLSEVRKKSAVVLQKSIRDTLRTLGMPDAEFSVRIESQTKPGPSGSDEVTFLISANPGEPLKPIQSIASGGELSRVMLALKTVLAKSDSIETQIFDEVDSGIGGTVARSLAVCISDLSKEKQVIAITHLASLASSAKAQFVVYKFVEQGRTYTKLKTVCGEDRVVEIARMLSGDADEVSLEHARKLISDQERN